MRRTQDGAARAPVALVPIPCTPLVGRGDDVAAVSALLDSPVSRFVTITGAGGLGKTRLAIEVAHRVAPSLDGGAVFVELDGVRDAAGVPAAIAAALSLNLPSDEEPAVALVHGLRHQQMLLVLDNLEHLPAAAPSIGELAGACPELRVLGTSRAALRVDGEYVVALEPLGVPPADEAEATAIGRCPSVQLFSERAHAVGARVGTDQATAIAIAKICRSLDGVPLAIELAAARTTAMSPAALLLQLEHLGSLDVLTRGSRDLAARHRTLRVAIEWSHELLRGDEQRLFRRLGVVQPGFDLDAVSAVGDDTAFDALAALVDLHLVEPDERGGDEPRYSMMGTVREFALERLDAAGERAAVSERHARHFTEVARQAAAETRYAGTAASMERVQLDHDNLIAALGYLTEAGDLDAALTVVVGLAPLWLDRGYPAPHRDQFERLLAVAGDFEGPLLALAAGLLWSSRLAFDQEDFLGRADATLTRLARGVEVARAAGDRPVLLTGLAFTTLGKAVVADAAASEAAALEGLDLARSSGDAWWIARFLSLAAAVAHQRGDLDEACELAFDALARARRIGDPLLIVDAALVPITLPRSLTARRNDLPSIESVLELARLGGDIRLQSFLQALLGAHAAGRGDAAAAASWCAESLTLAGPRRYWHAVGFATMCLAGVAVAQGDPAAAAHLHGGIERLRPVLREAMARGHAAGYDAIIDVARDQLGVEEFDAVAARASDQPLSDLVEEALAFAERVAGQSTSTTAPAARSEPSADGHELTPRELEVLREIATGGTNKDVARALGMTAKTVMHHCSSIYRKLGVRGRAEATAAAFRLDLV